MGWLKAKVVLFFNLRRLDGEKESRKDTRTVTAAGCKG